MFWTVLSSLILLAPLAPALRAAAPVIPQSGPLENLKIEGLAQSNATSAAQFSGQAILLEFFMIPCKPCENAVPKLNQLMDQYQHRGLQIIGVTKEKPATTVAWIQEHEARYPYGYSPGGALHHKYGVSKYPTSILLDPSGQEIWRGSPHKLDAATIERATAGALKAPLFTCSNEFSKVKDAFYKNQLGRALTAAEELARLKKPPGGAVAIAENLNQLIQYRLSAAAKLLENEQYLDARRELTNLKQMLEPRPEANVAKGLLDSLQKDPKAKAAIAASEELDEILRLPRKTDSQKKIRQNRLESLVARFPTTPAAERARKELEATKK